MYFETFFLGFGKISIYVHVFMQFFSESEYRKQIELSVALTAHYQMTRRDNLHAIES
jgi:hypothetical protein